VLTLFARSALVVFVAATLLSLSQHPRTSAWRGKKLDYDDDERLSHAEDVFGPKALALRAGHAPGAVLLSVHRAPDDTNIDFRARLNSGPQSPIARRNGLTAEGVHRPLPSWVFALSKAGRVDAIRASRELDRALKRRVVALHHRLHEIDTEPQDHPSHLQTQLENNPPNRQSFMIIESEPGTPPHPHPASVASSPSSTNESDHGGARDLECSAAGRHPGSTVGVSIVVAGKPHRDGPFESTEAPRGQCRFLIGWASASWSCSAAGDARVSP
jgi:hypothetical protein